MSQTGMASTSAGRAEAVPGQIDNRLPGEPRHQLGQDENKVSQRHIREASNKSRESEKNTPETTPEQKVIASADLSPVVSSDLPVDVCQEQRGMSRKRKQNFALGRTERKSVSRGSLTMAKSQRFLRPRGQVVGLSLYAPQCLLTLKRCFSSGFCSRASAPLTFSRGSSVLRS